MCEYRFEFLKKIAVFNFFCINRHWWWCFF